VGRLAIAVHGGAGSRSRPEAPAEEDVQAALLRALEAGRTTLEAGEAALDAVVSAVAVLEDDPAFNAGRGSVLTEAGTVEMDAAVMRGSDRAVGAVAAVRRVRRPVELAHALLGRGRDAILCGDAAERLARDLELETVPEETLVVERQRERWRRRSASPTLGTVGAVARDSRGGLAAATSTGGRAGQAVGRIGDSPIPGAGTWADSTTCAVSCTGDGEAIIRAACAHEVHARVRAGATPAEAAAAATAELARFDGTGGLIALGANGELAMPFTTQAMSRGWWEGAGRPGTAIG
jgi:L-asparaginase / beta-aspartyl-peptidase